MKIHVHIERLVIDGRLALDPAALDRAVVEALSQALLRQPVPALLRRSASVPALRGEVLHVGGSARAWGGSLAQAVHAALVAGAQPASRGESAPPRSATEACASTEMRDHESSDL
jgi:hypothetical protein